MDWGRMVFTREAMTQAEERISQAASRRPPGLAATPEASILRSVPKSFPE